MAPSNRIALCYDFDRTLSPDDMQAYSFIPSVGMDTAAFWAQSNAMAVENHMDRNLAWMKKMLDEAARIHRDLTRETFRDLGRDVALYPGLTTWFDRVNAYAAARGMQAEHYVISSGLKEMIEGTAIAKFLTRVYASAFYFDARGVAVWPAQVVNYTNKTQFIFRIAKGTFDENDESVNRSMPPERLHLPYRNLIYIGDSETDIPSMKVVRNKGGSAIGVYDPTTKYKDKVLALFEDHRLDYYAPADYHEDQPLYGYVCRLMDLAGARFALEREAEALTPDEP